MARSQRDGGVLWFHNDGGHAPKLYATDLQGKFLGDVAIQGVRNHDWEDLASIDLDGVPCLLVGDLGDNERRRKEGMIHIIPEPKAPTAGGKTKPSRTLTFRYEDGPRDCEGFSIDPISRKLYLVEKTKEKASIYSLDLNGPDDQTARKTGPLQLPAQPPAASFLSTLKQGILGGQVTAMDISPDGRSAAILTYTQCFVYKRSGGASWGETFSQLPARSIPLVQIHQPESACFDSSGQQIHYTSEELPAPLKTLKVAK
ncbi:MAG: hypothetical protein AAF514_24940 [Verrucomicrobiota bacterium]